MGSASPLAFWIGASLALHLVAAAVWPGTASAPASPAQARQLALHIISGAGQGVADARTPHRDVPEPIADRADARPAARATVNRTRPAARATALQAPGEVRTARQASAGTARPPAQAPRTATEPSLALRLQTRLLERLAEQLHYPVLAQRRGWEGVVLMELRLEANGDISRLHVLESSGYPLLDRAATQGLQRVARLPQARGWLRGEAFELVLPVHYRLIDS